MVLKAREGGAAAAAAAAAGGLRRRRRRLLEGWPVRLYPVAVGAAAAGVGQRGVEIEDLGRVVGALGGHLLMWWWRRETTVTEWTTVMAASRQ